MDNYSNQGSGLVGKTLQVYLTVQNVLRTEELRKLHLRKDDDQRSHYRIRCDVLLVQTEIDKLLAALKATHDYKEITVSTSSWTKTWFKETKGTVVRLYL